MQFIGLFNHFLVTDNQEICIVTSIPVDLCSPENPKQIAFVLRNAYVLPVRLGESEMGFTLQHSAKTEFGADCDNINTCK